MSTSQLSSSRPAKRAKKTHYHDRVSLEDDIEVIHSRSSRLNVRNVANETPRSPQKGRTTWVVGSAWAPEDDQKLALDDSADWFDEEMQAEVFESGPSRVTGALKKKYKKSTLAARPHIFWRNQHRSEYLDEDIRWEGRGDFKDGSGCPDCISRKRASVGVAEYRCRDCFLPDLTCKDCCVKRHQRLPLHDIEKWAGEAFSRVSLKSLGLQIHLNHASMRCPAPIPCHQDLKVLHSNGVHEVALSYCGCNRAIPRHLQLLRRGLYPASQISTRICVTFQLLRLLHLLSLTSKLSMYDLYRVLERLSDNVVSQEHRSRYRPLLRVSLQWRHLKMLKRGGRGHDAAGVAATKDGELAIMCPSCPHPGINLPNDWADAPDDERFLYSLLVCMDANFRLKNQLVSNYSSDPGLGVGWAYMVGRESYESYVLAQAAEDDISTCVGFMALAHRVKKFTRGLRYTGVGGAFCGRGEMILPNGVGNLQKGERYANMDYIFASAVKSSGVSSISISYDIACQWYKRLYDRMKSWPAGLRLGPQVETRPLIPKFHEPAHNEKNHEQFSFNLAIGVGKSDGEAPERVWAGHNGLGGSTKTQGPGSRHDVLDDHFGFWNWQKYCGMGATLMRRYKAAIVERNRQVEAHCGFTESLPSSMVTAWEEMCSAWDADRFPKSAKNPFSIEGSRITEAAVKEQLANEERERAEHVPPLHSTSPSTWLAMGLELEDSQRRLRARARALGDKPTDLQKGSVQEQRAALAKNMKNWESLRAIYIPGLLQYQADVGVGDATAWDADPRPEDVELFLPSRLPQDRRGTACVVGLPEIEAKLRTAQCVDALASLRQTLRLKTRMVQFKNKNIRGQKEGTHSRALIDRVHQRALASVDKYRAAREALLSISGPGGWEKTLQPLLNGDVRSYVEPERKSRPGRRGIWEDGEVPLAEAPNDAEISAYREKRSRRDGTGRTTHVVSWIWRTGTVDADSEDGDDVVVRSEWARSRARVQRCKEEVLLLLEEMRRVLQFLDWRARWWDGRQISRKNINSELQEGLMAYALDQAAVQRRLSAAFQKIWKTPLRLVDEVDQFAAEADHTSDGDSSDDGNDSNNGDDEGNDSGDDDGIEDDGGGNDMNNGARMDGGGDWRIGGDIDEANTTRVGVRCNEKGHGARNDGHAGSGRDGRDGGDGNGFDGGDGDGRGGFGRSFSLPHTCSDVFMA